LISRTSQYPFVLKFDAPEPDKPNCFLSPRIQTESEHFHEILADLSSGDVKVHDPLSTKLVALFEKLADPSSALHGVEPVDETKLVSSVLARATNLFGRHRSLVARHFLGRLVAASSSGRKFLLHLSSVTGKGKVVSLVYKSSNKVVIALNFLMEPFDDNQQLDSIDLESVIGAKMPGDVQINMFNFDLHNQIPQEPHVTSSHAGKKIHKDFTVFDGQAPIEGQVTGKSVVNERKKPKNKNLKPEWHEIDPNEFTLYNLLPENARGGIVDSESDGSTASKSKGRVQGKLGSTKSNKPEKGVDVLTMKIVDEVLPYFDAEKGIGAISDGTLSGNYQVYQLYFYDLKLIDLKMTFQRYYIKT